jgi:hypothetical protein
MGLLDIQENRDVLPVVVAGSDGLVRGNVAHHR